jgi:hypothetical protein
MFDMLLKKWETEGGKGHWLPVGELSLSLVPPIFGLALASQNGFLDKGEVLARLDGALAYLRRHPAQVEELKMKLVKLRQQLLGPTGP